MAKYILLFLLCCFEEGTLTQLGDILAIEGEAERNVKNDYRISGSSTWLDGDSIH